MLISCCSSGLFESQEGAGATTPTAVDVPFRRQLNGLLLPAEGAGRRLASLPGLRGILSGGAHPGDDEAQVIGDPKNSFSPFCAPPQAA